MVGGGRVEGKEGGREGESDMKSSGEVGTM